MALDINLYILKFIIWQIQNNKWHCLRIVTASQTWFFLACSQSCQFSDSIEHGEDVYVYKNTSTVQHLVGFVICVGAELLNWSDNFLHFLFSFKHFYIQHREVMVAHLYVHCRRVGASLCTFLHSDLAEQLRLIFVNFKSIFFNVTAV